MDKATGYIESVNYEKNRKGLNSIRFKFSNSDQYYVYYFVRGEDADNMADKMAADKNFMEILFDSTDLQKPLLDEKTYYNCYQIILGGLSLISYEDRRIQEDSEKAYILWFGILLVFVSLYELVVRKNGVKRKSNKKVH